jgi:hypothetical protein
MLVIPAMARASNRQVTETQNATVFVANWFPAQSYA